MRIRSIGRVVTVGLLAAVATLAVASRASAAAFQFEEHDPAVTETFACGAVYTFATDINGRFIINGNDEFVRAVELDTFTGTITYQGRTFRADDHQTVITFVRRDVLQTALNGQGVFTNLPGLGHVFDVGHLIFREGTGETLQASSKVIGLNDPFDFGAAICALLTE